VLRHEIASLTQKVLDSERKIKETIEENIKLKKETTELKGKLHSEKENTGRTSNHNSARGSDAGREIEIASTMQGGEHEKKSSMGGDRNLQEITGEVHGRSS